MLGSMRIEPEINYVIRKTIFKIYSSGRHILPPAVRDVL